MVHLNVSLVEKDNIHELYADSSFTKFSKYPSDIAL